MPTQENIALTALAASIAGISLLLILSQTLEPKQVKIREISQSLQGWQVRTNAKIASRHQRNGTLFLQLYDGTATVKAVIFNPSQEEQRLTPKNGFATFEGRVQTYEGELEVVVERVLEWA